MGSAKAAAGGVIVYGHRVLLIRKRLNDEYRLPKGGLDPGESEEQAALREVAEETGFSDLAITADLGEELAAYRTPQGWIERRQRFYRMELRSFARRPRSLGDARRFEVCWHDLNQALELISFASERAVLQRV